MLSLLGSLLGFGTSIFPSILEFFQDSKEKKHELAAMEMQLKLMDKQTELNIKETRVNGEMEAMALELKAELASVKAAHQPQQMIGIGWVDALRGSVRPIITYWFMALYTYSKWTLYMAQEPVWSEYDLALFSTILSFWFGDRIRKYLKVRSNG